MLSVGRDAVRQALLAASSLKSQHCEGSATLGYDQSETNAFRKPTRRSVTAVSFGRPIRCAFECADQRPPSEV